MFPAEKGDCGSFMCKVINSSLHSLLPTESMELTVAHPKHAFTANRIRVRCERTDDMCTRANSLELVAALVLDDLLHRQDNTVSL